MNLTTTTQDDGEIVGRVMLAMVKQVNATTVDELTQKLEWWWNGFNGI